MKNLLHSEKERVKNHPWFYAFCVFLFVFILPSAFEAWGNFVDYRRPFESYVEIIKIVPENIVQGEKEQDIVVFERVNQVTTAYVVVELQCLNGGDDWKVITGAERARDVVFEVPEEDSITIREQDIPTTIPVGECRWIYAIELKGVLLRDNSRFIASEPFDVKPPEQPLRNIVEDLEAKQ